MVRVMRAEERKRNIHKLIVLGLVAITISLQVEEGWLVEL